MAAGNPAEKLEGSATPKIGVETSLATRVLQRLQKRFDACHIVSTLRRVTEGDFYIFGGTIRRIIFEDRQSGDLDLIVPNGDLRAFRALDALNIPFILNRNHHRRYNWNAQQIDFFQPNEFHHGFDDVRGVLRFVDLKINTIALHVRTEEIIDPFQVLSQMPPADPGINWSRWEAMSPLELSVLTIRLLKIMHETPGLTISKSDADRLRKEVIPKIMESDWALVHSRFPLGKKAFLQTFQRKVLDRARFTTS